MSDELATPQTSDGFHTFAELYDHRHALFVALAVSHASIAWRSREHGDDKPMFEGYFIAGMDLPTGQVSYHLPIDWWDDLDGLRTLPASPQWDGHTADDVVRRLRAWAAAA